MQLHILKASTESEIDAAFAALVQQQAGALLVASDPFFVNRREQIAALVLARMPLRRSRRWRSRKQGRGLVAVERGLGDCSSGRRKHYR